MNKKNLVGLILIMCVLLLIAVIVIMIIIPKSTTQEETEEISDDYFSEESIVIKEHYEINEFTYTDVSTEQLINIYFYDLINKLSEDYKEVYNLLDEEYRSKKFGSVESFYQYLVENEQEIFSAKIERFEVNNNYYYDEYILQDQYGNYYIFNVTAVMKYTVMLDKYTVPTESFIEEYNQLDDKEKAAKNLIKFLEALKDKDYKYAYSKLDTTFKENNFITEADFENYINQNWENYENIETVNVEEQEEIYVCIPKIEGEDNQQEQRKFMIQLGSDVEYQLSLDI